MKKLNKLNNPPSRYLLIMFFNRNLIDKVIGILFFFPKIEKEKKRERELNYVIFICL